MGYMLGLENKRHKDKETNLNCCLTIAIAYIPIQLKNNYTNCRKYKTQLLEF